MANILAWHFCGKELTLGYGDNRPIVVGETISVDPPIELCKRGLHASPKILDALYYAPGTVICRVRLSGEVIRGSDKIVATHRTVLWYQDIELALRVFAIDCREREMLYYTKTPPVEAMDAIKAARDYLAGKIDLTALKAAKNRAWHNHYATTVAWTLIAVMQVVAAGTTAAVVAEPLVAAAVAAAQEGAASLVVSAGGMEMTAEREWQSQHLRKLIGKTRRGEPLL
jgi:hypothetical protein